MQGNFLHQVHATDDFAPEQILYALYIISSGVHQGAFTYSRPTHVYPEMVCHSDAVKSRKNGS
jgi:hypothetical protein